MSPYDWAIVLLGMLLQSMVISAMLGGAVKRYPLVFGYVVFSFFSTVVQVSFQEYFGRRSKEFIRAYWVVDFIGTFLLLMVIIHFIRLAMEKSRHRSTVYWGLLLGVAGTAAATVLLMRYSGRAFTLGKWLTEVGRDYYFSAVLLNAILWMVLVRRHHEDQQLYLLASGLGLKLCGAAIAHAFRLLEKPLWLGNQVMVVTYLLSLYVWYVALQRLPAIEPVGEEKLTASRP